MGGLHAFQVFPRLYPRTVPGTITHMLPRRGAYLAALEKIPEAKSEAKSMCHVDDVIDDAPREHNISQVASAGSAGVCDALRSLLAPHNTPAAELAALQELLPHFQQGGFEEVFRSWIGPRSNAPIEPDQLGNILGGKTVHELSGQTGMPPQALLDELARLLPTVIDRLTPQGSLLNFKGPQPGSRV
jgi:uncharacterized protein YidB (DUF937 family)